MKEYFLSVDLDSSVMAESEDEAYKKAMESIKEGFYSLKIVDVEEVKE